MSDCNSPALKKRRIVFVKQNENQAIKEVLLAFYALVVEKDMNIAKKIELALTSLSKYPLKLTSGEDCLILQGFNKNLCRFVDEQLFKKIPISGPKLCLPSPPKALKVKKIEMPKTLARMNTTTEINLTNNLKRKMDNDIQLMSNKKIQQNLEIKPVLVALSQQKLEFPDRPALNLKELMLKTQSYCTTPITDWEFLRVTEEKQKYIKTELHNDIPFYSLTAIGKQLADAYIKNGECCKNNNKEQDMKNDRVSNKKCMQPTPSVQSDLQRVQNEYPLIIDMAPGTYDIIMLVDKNEPDLFCQETNNIKCEKRSLKVGDVLWIARSKINSQELVLPHILERKRMDDFAASIIDGRFHEQKFRLKKCGLSHVVYLIENYKGSKHCTLSTATLSQAMANTRVQDGFLVHCTRSLNDTKTFLNIMTLRLTNELKDVHLRGSNTDSGTQELMTFEYFSASSSKTKPLTIKDLFIKMLLQLKRLSVEKALAITKVYNSPKQLMEAYDLCSPRDAELLLANLKFNSMTPRVSPAISKTIYMLFNDH